MNNYEMMDRVAKESVGKTIESMEIGSSTVTINFTDGGKIEMNFDFNEGYGFSNTIEES